MSNSPITSPTKNNDEPPLTHPIDPLSQQITIAYPLQTVFPEESTTKKVSSSKKGSRARKSTSSPATTKVSNQKGKKSKSKSVYKSVHTMQELYIKNLEEPNVDASAGATVNEKTTSPFDLKSVPLGLSNPRSAENLGKKDLETSVSADDDIGAYSKAKFDSVLELIKKFSTKQDAAHHATASTVPVDFNSSLVADSPERNVDPDNTPNKTVPNSTDPNTPIIHPGSDNVIDNTPDADHLSNAAANDNPGDSHQVVIDVDNFNSSGVRQPPASMSRRLRSSASKEKDVSGTPAKTPQKKATVVGPKKQWSKVIGPSESKKKSLKRKVVSSSDSDFEDDAAAPIAASSQKAAKKKKTVEDIPPVPIDNISFHRVENAERWKIVVNRRLALERNLHEDFLECQEIMDLINKAGLLKTVTGLGNCYEKLTREFLVNVTADCGNPLSSEYLKVFVRGRCVDFSPAIINQSLGRSTDPSPELEVSMKKICSILTGGGMKTWPRTGKLPAAKLTAKYALLNKIAASNWVPTTHSNSVATGLAKFIYAVGTGTCYDYGTHIFHATILHGSSTAVKMPIAFPTLICSIILSQHPDICTTSDVPVSRPSALTMDFRLLEGKHAADIAVASLKTPAVGMTKRQMIANLREVSNMLGEKKELIDGVIQALELEQTKANEDGVGPSHDVSHDDDLAGGDTVEEEMASDESPSI
ncbi:uncharacterized protein LOC123891267 [Trifolium pratense]|nr:uncharacterized protein LOC123891267 [Trifolium pratense]